MKRFLIPFMVLFMWVGVSCQLNAQKDKKDKSVTIKIEKDENGKKTKVDTTFTLKEGENLDEILEKYGVEAEVMHLNHGKKFKFNIETDDSLNTESQAMVWVSVDNDNDIHKHIIKKSGKNKIVFIGDDDDGIEVIELKEDGNIDWNEQGEEVFIEKPDGDSVKIKKKIVIKGDKDGKHKIKSKKGVFIISDDATVDFDDEFDNESVIIKELKDGSDSVEVIIKKLKGDKKGKKVVVKSDGKYAWIIDNDDDDFFATDDAKFNRVKLRILDVDEQGLKILNLKEDYKEFRVKDFDVFVKEKESKIEFEFKTPQKGALSVKIVDEKGNVVLTDSKKNFDGMYKNEIEAKSGTYYIQISQGKKLYVRKMTFELTK